MSRPFKPLEKKTPKQKQKEEEEARRLRDEEELGQVYSEFVATFDTSKTGPKTWVKGSTIQPTPLYQPEDVHQMATAPPAPKTLYRPQQRFVSAASNIVEPAKEQVEEKTMDAPRLGRKRDLDTFLEELKKEQEDRDVRLRHKHARLSGADAPMALYAAFEDGQGSHDTGDPHTTNLYIGNINPITTEEDLCKLFAVYGPIASIKIMHPRTQVEIDRGRNTGFVSFMTRQDAATALKECDGREVSGFQIKLGWGKPIPLPAQPIYVHGKTTGTTMKTGLPFNAQLPSASKVFASGTTMTQNKRPEVRVSRPNDDEIVMLIHRMVERVIKHGPMFEAMIMDRELQNPKFAFLFQNDSAEHIYYRWRLYSILQGDAKNVWPTETFQMFDEGPVWTPPEIPFDDSAIDLDDLSDESDASEGRDGVKRRKPVPGIAKGTLSRTHRVRLEAHLRRLTFERGTIARAMVFCIDHADAADEIADIIVSSLVIPATPVFPNKIARLYLVSDVLHNSGTPLPNVWKFRNAFETRLAPVFEHLASVWQTISARLRAEQMRRAVISILGVWETWLIFSSDYIQSLKAKFSESSSKASVEDSLAERLQQQRESHTGAYGLDESVDDYGVLGGSKQPAISHAYGAFAPVEGGDDEDVDGIPMDMASGTNTSGALNNFKPVGEDDDDEDVDGVPFVAIK
ncbi:hypothetical protein SmJEL517_g05890 [Synchytrium microbalum]|uniref:U2 snRNP-associated SURP motif-containing protein n=1 Tax=Synchytrium microbalum TaxID=1806994 RepID=A0A507BXZ8_9FUNG|nr:uncharacterized protein SmJEL517_g05890 [Synchytrium microbalum]TPX30596.1 hypothetical protein SmJEL517_g05890 [Synchytrium microbalum]